MDCLILNIQVNSRETKIFLNTKKDVTDNSDACVRIIDLQSFKEIDKVNCPGSMKYFKRIQVIGDTEEDERLIGSGDFGVMVYECMNKKRSVKKGPTEKGFIGINYI